MSTLEELAAALDDTSETASMVTSVRMPVSLKRALSIAVELGLLPSVNEVVVKGLRDQLDAVTQNAALEAIFTARPELRPTLAETTLLLAQMDRNPLADHPEILAQAAREAAQYSSDADADDALIWAAALKAHPAALDAHTSQQERSA